MTDLEKLTAAKNNLAAIRAPIAFTESVTIPVYQSMLLIDQVCESLAKAQKKEEVSVSDVQVTPEDPGADVEEIPSEGVLFNQNGNDEAP